MPFSLHETKPKVNLSQLKSVIVNNFNKLENSIEELTDITHPFKIFIVLSAKEFSIDEHDNTLSYIELANAMFHIVGKSSIENTNFNKCQILFKNPRLIHVNNKVHDAKLKHNTILTIKHNTVNIASSSDLNTLHFNISEKELTQLRWTDIRAPFTPNSKQWLTNNVKKNINHDSDIAYNNRLFKSLQTFSSTQIKNLHEFDKSIPLITLTTGSNNMFDDVIVFYPSMSSTYKLLNEICWIQFENSSWNNWDVTNKGYTTTENSSGKINAKYIGPENFNISREPSFNELSMKILNSSNKLYYYLIPTKVGFSCDFTLSESDIKNNKKIIKTVENSKTTYIIILLGKVDNTVQEEYVFIGPDDKEPIAGDWGWPSNNLPASEFSYYSSINLKQNTDYTINWTEKRNDTTWFGMRNMFFITKKIVVD